jgi:hypothetical protein
MVAWRARIGLIKPTHRGNRADVHWLSQREAGKLS